MDEIGYTRKELSRDLGIGETTLSFRLNGRKPWQKDEMYKVLEVFKVPEEYLHIVFPKNIYSKKTAAGEGGVREEDMEVAVYGFSGIRVCYREGYQKNEEVDEPGVARMQRDGDGSGHIALSFESGKG
jgi:hypothetical protein